MAVVRRSEKVGALIAVGAVALGCIVSAAVWPGQPQKPRYVGAGHETPQRGGTFVFHHTANVRSLDPHIGYDELSLMAIRLLFDGLLDYDRNGDVVPRLAREMPEVSDDGKTFTFRLREGVKFHNGRELTAEDVRWSMEHMLSAEVGSPGYPFYQAIVGAQDYHEGDAEHVEGIRVRDRYTIELRLERPDQTFLDVMAMAFAYPVPKESYERWGSEVSMHPVGTGPFVLDGWERGVKLELEAFRDYWQPGKPYPDRMVYLENLERHVAAMRFRNADLDAVHRFPAADYLFFEQAKAWAPYREEYPVTSTYGIGMNTQMPPFDDVHFRRAIAFALDREGWSRARNNRLEPAGQPIPPQLPGYDPDLPERQRFDLEQAKREMRLAGYPDGYPEQLTVMMTEGETGRIYGELLQDDLEEIGIDIRVRQVSFAVYLQQTGKPNTTRLMTIGWNVDFPDPANFFDPIFHSRQISDTNSSNRTFYSNPELDDLLDRARVEQDADERLAMYRRANAIVAHDAPWAFTYYPLQMELWQPYVKGYRPHPVWAQDYRDVWLDLPRKKVARLYMGPRYASSAPLFAMGGFFR